MLYPYVDEPREPWWQFGPENSLDRSNTYTSERACCETTCLPNNCIGKLNSHRPVWLGCCYPCRIRCRRCCTPTLHYSMWPGIRCGQQHLYGWKRPVVSAPKRIRQMTQTHDKKQMYEDQPHAEDLRRGTGRRSTTRTSSRCVATYSCRIVSPSPSRCTTGRVRLSAPQQNPTQQLAHNPSAPVKTKGPKEPQHMIPTTAHTLSPYFPHQKPFA